MEKWRAEIRNKWMSHAPRQYWGDDLDVRYYLAKELKKLHGKKILDIGCNIGIILSEAAGDNERHGLDLDRELIGKAKNVCPECDFITGDATRLPFGNGEFDAVVLAHLWQEGNEKMLEEAMRVLRKGGTLYLTTPNGKHPYYSNKRMYREGLAEALGKVGFRYEIRGFNPIPLPVKLIGWIPGIFGLLEYLSGKDALVDRCRGFYVEAVK